MNAHRIIALIAFLIAGWIIVSLALSGDVFQATVPISFGSLITALAPTLGDIVLTVSIVLLSWVLYWIIRDRKLLVERIRAFFNKSKSKRKYVIKSRRDLKRDLIGIMLVFGLLIVIRSSGLLQPAQPPKGGGNSTEGSIFQIPGLDGQRFQSSLLAIYHFIAVWSIQIVFLATAGLLLVIFVQAMARPRAVEQMRTQSDAAIIEETISVLQEGARDLWGGDDYRKSILECYRRLCEIFDPRGDRSHHQLTARELRELMVRQFGLVEKPISLLTRLFEEARYSQHLISANMRANAIEALKEIEDYLRHSSEGTIEPVQ